MKKLLSIVLLLPLLLLTSCEESLTIGVHYKNGDNIVHYACSSAHVLMFGNTLKIRTKGNTTQFLNGDYVTYSLPSACPVCGYEGELL